MATIARRATPAHLWIIGFLALLWNAFGCYDYLMIVTANAAYLGAMPGDQIAYMNGLPSWLTALWAVGVWGGLVGSVLMLMRSRYSVWAFGLSLVGAVVGIGYQMLLTARPASMSQGMMGMIEYVVIIVAAFLLWYSWSEEKKGVLK